MFLPNHYSFTLARKKTLKNKADFFPSEIIKKQQDQCIGNDIEVAGENNDKQKRDFLKFLGGAGVGAVVMSLIPDKAQAFIIGSSPTAGIIGVKDSTNTHIDPATENGNLATLAAKDFATQTTLSTRASESTLSAIKANSDKLVFDINGNLLTSGTISGVVAVKDANNTTVSPSTEESAVLLRRILKQVDSLAVVDSAQRQKVTIDSITTALTLTSVTGVVNLQSLGNVDGKYLYIDTARNAYANGTRSNLTFS